MAVQLAICPRACARLCENKMRLSKVISAAHVLILLAISSSASFAQEWVSFGGDAGGTRYSPLAQINRENVKSLQRAWTYHMGELDRSGNATDRHHIAPFESTPLIIDGILYFS